MPSHQITGPNLQSFLLKTGLLLSLIWKFKKRLKQWRGLMRNKVLCGNIVRKCFIISAKNRLGCFPKWIDCLHLLNNLASIND